MGERGWSGGRSPMARAWVGLVAVMAAVLAAVLVYVAVMALLFAGGSDLLLWALLGVALLGLAVVLVRRFRSG